MEEKDKEIIRLKAPGCGDYLYITENEKKDRYNLSLINLPGENANSISTFNWVEFNSIQQLNNFIKELHKMVTEHELKKIIKEGNL